MATGPWLADEMLGRLARYLRFVGEDTEYVRGERDEAVAERARREGRILLTRDRELARAVPGAVLLPSTSIAEQFRTLVRRFPGIPTEPRFTRCTLCNGPLRALTPAARFRCGLCGHEYWEGSHTASVRRRLQDWAATEGT